MRVVHAVVGRYGVDLTDWGGYPVHTDNLPLLIRQAFGNVETVLHHNALLFPTPEAFSRYAVSMLGLFGIAPDFPQRPAVVTDIITESRRLFDTTAGPVRDPKGYSVSTARA